MSAGTIFRVWVDTDNTAYNADRSNFVDLADLSPAEAATLQAQGWIIYDGDLLINENADPVQPLAAEGDDV